MIWVLALGRFADEQEDTGGDGDEVIKFPYEYNYTDDAFYNISLAWFTKLFLQFSLSPSPSSSAWESISARFLQNIFTFQTILTTDLTIINISTVQHKRQFKSSPSKASAASQQGQTTAASYLQQYARPPSQVTATTRVHKSVKTNTTQCKHPSLKTMIVAVIVQRSFYGPQSGQYCTVV